MRGRTANRLSLGLVTAALVLMLPGTASAATASDGFVGRVFCTSWSYQMTGYGPFYQTCTQHGFYGGPIVRDGRYSPYTRLFYPTTKWRAASPVMQVGNIAF